MDAKTIKEEKAKVEIWQYVFGFTPMAVVKCAIELEIADAVESHGGAMSLPDLASAVACSPSALVCEICALRSGCRRSLPPSAAPSPVAVDTTPLLSDQIFRPHRRPRFLRRASSRSRAMREPSVRVREAAADQIEELQSDWGLLFEADN
ncbi:hypothetical protein SASPL_129232 [Salvia splendens]|uniref:O-methyltransferase dimerisation domain-containing protein n=1 Tax=Salvia splendens TaxID=180675 RepID=A0A8X8XDZ1_SALSN|nr:hypothetical protein SASPL_129232 [Salvia splendens]